MGTHVQLNEKATERAILLSRALDMSVNAVVNFIMERITADNLEGVISVKTRDEQAVEKKAEKVLRPKRRPVRMDSWLDGYKVWR